MTVEECEIEEEYHPPPAKEALEEHIHEESSQEDLNDEDPMRHQCPLSRLMKMKLFSLVFLLHTR
jgi:hypothetical protein